MHHPYLHREAKLQRLLVIIIQLPSRYPGLNHQLFLALLPSQLELDEEEPPLLPSLHPGPGCRGPDAHKFPRPCRKASEEESGSQGHRYRHQPGHSASTHGDLATRLAWPKALSFWAQGILAMPSILGSVP